MARPDDAQPPLALVSAKSANDPVAGIAERWLPWLSAGAVAIVLAYVIHTALGEPSWQLYQLLYLDGEANLVSWFGSFLWAVAALAAYDLAVRTGASDRGVGRTWRILTALLIFLSCDEVATLHERWSEMLSRHVWGGQLWLPEAHWVLLFGPFILLTFVRLGWRLRRALGGSVVARRRLLLGAVLFAGGAMGVEMLLNAIPLSAPKWLFQAQIVIEEAMEMAGALCVVAGLSAHQQRVQGDKGQGTASRSQEAGGRRQKAEGRSSVLCPLSSVTGAYRIVCIIDDLGRGGAQRQLVELAKGLDRRRFALRVIALSVEKVTYRSALEALGVPVALIGHHGAFSPTTLLRVYRLLRRWRPALVQTWLFTADCYGRLAARLAGVPSVISTVRSPEPDKPRRYIWVDRWLAGITDRVVVNAACTAEVCQRRERIPARKLAVVYNGIDPALFDIARADGTAHAALALPASVRIVGSVGRLEPVKRYDDLVAAFAPIARRDPRLHLCLVGEGRLRDALARQAQDAGIADRVHLSGAQPAEAIADLVAAMEVFVLPSEYEGCSNAILEAMAMGKPVVATDVGGNRELLGNAKSVHSPPSPPHIVADPPRLVADTVHGTSGASTVDRGPSTMDVVRFPYEVADCGLLVRRGDVEGLAAAIRHLLDDPALERRLGAQGRARVEQRFTTAHMAQAMAAVYEEALA